MSLAVALSFNENVDINEQMGCERINVKKTTRSSLNEKTLTLDSHAECPGSNLTIAAALLSFSKAIYPHCCSPPRCINGGPR